jgi:hypothetical protein
LLHNYCLLRRDPKAEIMQSDLGGKKVFFKSEPVQSCLRFRIEIFLRNSFAGRLRHRRVGDYPFEKEFQGGNKVEAKVSADDGFDW